MPIKNYTTKVDVFQSIGETQGALAKNGARKIMIDYDEVGNPCGLIFGLQTNQGLIAFQLPTNVEGVIAALKRDKVKCDEQQALRIAWRNVRDWVLAQMAFIEAGNVQVDEVFLPYLLNAQRQTLFNVYKNGQLSIGDTNNFIENR